MFDHYPNFAAPEIHAGDPPEKSNVTRNGYRENLSVFRAVSACVYVRARESCERSRVCLFFWFCLLAPLPAQAIVCCMLTFVYNGMLLAQGIACARDSFLELFRRNAGIRGARSNRAANEVAGIHLHRLRCQRCALLLRKLPACTSVVASTSAVCCLFLSERKLSSEGCCLPSCSCSAFPPPYPLLHLLQPRA